MARSRHGHRVRVSKQPCSQSDYILLGGPRWKVGDWDVKWVISNVFALIMAAQGTSPGLEKRAFQWQKRSYSDGIQ